MRPGIKRGNIESNVQVVTNRIPTLTEEDFLGKSLQVTPQLLQNRHFLEILVLPKTKELLVQKGDLNYEMQPCVGFVTVRRHSEIGFFGGFLIVNLHGRPVEFHCTLPVKPSRAQEILYGKTLGDFIGGEQITRALTSKAKLSASLIFTDCAIALSSRFVTDRPIALVSKVNLYSPEPRLLCVPESSMTGLIRFKLGTYELSIPNQHPEDESTILRLWTELKTDIDLAEPFERISDALLEAHPAARAA